MSDISNDERAALEAFVYREARLADESDYEAWEALVDDEVHYWVPQGRANYDPATRLSYINDNRARLSTRIRQLRSGLRHAQTPASPMRRLLSNLEFEREDDGYQVAGNFVLYEHAVQSNNSLRIWAGRVVYGLRPTENGLRMRRKIVELVNGAHALPSLAFLI